MFRRSSSFRGRGSSFRSRFRRRGMRTAKSPQKYNRANFFIDTQQTLPSGSASEVLSYFHMGSQAVSLTGYNVASDIQRAGAVMAGMVKALEIGGLVFDHWVLPISAIAGDLGVDAQQQGIVHVQHGLLYDRQTAFAGAYTPVSVGSWSPWQQGTPITQLGPATSQPPDISEEPNFPTRVLYRRSDTLNLAPLQVQNQQEGNLYVPNGQELARFRFHYNKRLRLRLDEDFGLYLYFATRNSPTFALATAERRLLHVFCGALYYRWLR